MADLTEEEKVRCLILEMREDLRDCTISNEYIRWPTRALLEIARQLAITNDHAKS